MRKTHWLLGLITMSLIIGTSLTPQAPVFANEKKGQEHRKPSSLVSNLPSYERLTTRGEKSRPEGQQEDSSKRSSEAQEVINEKQFQSIYSTGLFKNAPKPLITPTYEGSGQAVHPSVIDFKVEYNLEAWRGYRYWMAMSPYPNGYERHENPCLLASNDGLKWEIPAGLSQPLDILPGQANFNSDPTLVYDPDSKSLLIYWRETLRKQYDRIWRIKYPSSGNLEPKALVLEEPWGKQGKVTLSPSIWRKSSKEWYMWTTSGTGAVYIYDSPDGVIWNNKRQTQLPWQDWNGGFVPWHLEVKPNLKQDKVDILLSGWPKSGKPTDQVLIYAEAPIKDLTAISLPFNQPLLAIGLANQWDGDFLYKSSFVREEKNGQPLFHIWYSARSTNGTWHMGYTEGTLAYPKEN